MRRHLPSLLKAAVPLAALLAVVPPVAGQVLNKSGGTPPAEEAGASVVEPGASANFAQITRIYESWSVQCREQSGEGRCFVETVVRQSKPTLRDVIVLRLAKAPEGVQVTIVTPNRVKLDRGATIGVGGQNHAAAYSICGPVNCNAALTSTRDLVDRLRAQKEIAVSFHIFAPAEEGGEREIRIPVSLAGFAAAFDNLLVLDTEQ